MAYQFYFCVSVFLCSLFVWAPGVASRSTEQNTLESLLKTIKAEQNPLQACITIYRAIQSIPIETHTALENLFRIAHAMEQNIAQMYTATTHHLLQTNRHIGEIPQNHSFATYGIHPVSNLLKTTDPNFGIKIREKVAFSIYQQAAAEAMRSRNLP